MAYFDISVDEILSALDKIERLRLFDELSQEFESEEGPRLKGKAKLLTPTESDFQKILLDLWERRSILTPDQIERIRKTSTEPFI
jgi:hypothetical protein